MAGFWRLVGTVALLPVGLVTWPAWLVAMLAACLLAIGPLIFAGLFVYALFWQLPHWWDSNPWLTLGWLGSWIVGIPLAFGLLGVAGMAAQNRAFRWSGLLYAALLLPLAFLLYGGVLLAGLITGRAIAFLNPWEMVGNGWRYDPHEATARAVRANTDAVREQTGIIASQWR